MKNMVYNVVVTSRINQNGIFTSNYAPFLSETIATDRNGLAKNIPNIQLTPSVYSLVRPSSK